MKIGATLDKTAISYWQPKLSKNNWMRIFPNKAYPELTNDNRRFPPVWTDSRFTYCQTVGADPFISCRCESDATLLANLRQHLIDMPSWIKTLWITDHHEPESDISPEAYKSNFLAFWNMIQGLPAATRARIKAGPILTNINTEDKFAGDYAVHDPGVGDFFGVDTYARSYAGSPAGVITSYPAVPAFLSKIKAYNSGSRPKCFPELGAIGIPADTTGSMRATWIQQVHDEVKTWSGFLGWIWWNDDGTSGSALPGSPGIGSARYFQLDRRHTGANDATLGTGNAYATLNPALPLNTYNSIATAENSTTATAITVGTAVETDTALPVGVSAPVPSDPGGGTGGSTGTPDEEPPALLPIGLDNAPALLAAEYTLLFTDRNLNVLGDPLVNWTTLDITLRHNEVGSGQFTVPGYPWIRQQMVPGGRIVCIRRALGRSSIVLAGPIEQTVYERSDDGENGGDGKFTVTWASDLAWVAGRLAYPNPALAPSAQTTDNWTWNGNSELGMRALVEGNAGQTALLARRVPKLTLGTLNNVGTSIIMGAAGADGNPTSKSTRLLPVTEVLRDMAKKGGNLGFRTRQVGNQILFEVFAPRDLSRQCRFSFGLGNLKYISYEVNAPEVTSAIVGGQGSGSDRFILERTNTAHESAWGRLETLVSRPGNDPTIELNEAGDDALKEAGASVRLASNAADTVDQRYGVHYDVGDLVTIEVWPGQSVTDLVQTVHIQAFPTAGEVVGVTVGSQAANYDSAMISRLRDIDRRVGLLERSVVSV